MNNEQREQQMMTAAEAYAEEVGYKDEHDLCATLNVFCAGWRAADQHPAWIPVEEELPKETGWYLVATPTLNSKIDVALWDGKWFRLITITHWMPLPVPPQRKEE